MSLTWMLYTAEYFYHASCYLDSRGFYQWPTYGTYVKDMVAEDNGCYVSDKS